MDENGGLAYSVFQQGAGLVNAPGAVDSTANGCANRGLDIDRDLAGAERNFALAGRLAPFDWTNRRAAVKLVGGDPFDFATLPDRVEQVWKDGVLVVGDAAG